MGLENGICPACKREIEVNTAEEVDFCKHCGKPYSTKDAVRLYTENQRYVKAAKKPSDEAIAKFNAVLAQDYKLAQKYLEGIIKKEYPMLSLPVIPDASKIIYFGKEDEYKEDDYSYDGYPEIVKRFERDFENLRSANQWLADMFYKLLPHNLFTLKTLKMRLYNIKHRLYCLNLFSNDYDVSYITRRNNADNLTIIWKSIENDIAEQKHLCGKEFDDSYVDSAINEINHCKAYNINSFLATGLCVPDDMRNKRVSDLAASLEDFYSPAKKRILAAQRAEEEKKALEEEVAFWRGYIDLLKAGKAKDALELLTKKKKPSQTDEFSKFKKGLLGVKYKGEVALLNADTLAGLPAKSSVTSSKKNN